MRKFFIFFVLCCSMFVQAQITGISIAQAPLASGGSTSTLYTAIVNQVFGNTTTGTLAKAVTAVTPIVCWNTVDTGTTAMSLNWTTLDADLNAWITNGATRVNIIFAPALEGGNNTCTPAYVFTSTYATAISAPEIQDMVVTLAYKGGSASPYGNANGATGCSTGCDYNSNTTGNACVTPGCTFSNTTGDTSGLPVSLPSEPIASAWPAFIQQVFLHFNTSLCSTGVGTTDCTNAATVTSHLGYIKFGFKQGGENSVVGQSFWPLTNTGFSTFIAADSGTNSVAPTTPVCYVTGTGGVLSFVENLTNILGTDLVTYAPTWKVVISLHSNGSPPNNSTADCAAVYAVANNIGLGTNGLQYSDPANYAAVATPLLADATNGDSDWPYNIDKYYLSIPGTYLQTLTTSDPTNGVDTPSGITTGPTGALTTIVPFARQHHVGLLEMYPCDAIFAFAASWSSLPASGNSGSLTNCQSMFNQGAGSIQTSTLGVGGSGYAVGNTGTIAGGTGGTYTVNTVSSGVVLTYTISNFGTGYTATTETTSATSGSGTGLTITLTEVAQAAGSFNTSGGGAGVNNAYAVALYNFAQGSPAATAGISGSSGVTGSGGVQ
jgi:hypothetical protein